MNGEEHNFDQRRNAINMDLYIIPVIYKALTINLIITEDTNMTELENRGFVLSEKEEKESFGEYVARKKQDRRAKRFKDKQHQNKKEYIKNMSEDLRYQDE